MMASISPIEQHRAVGSGYASTHNDGSKSPLSMSLGFLKNLTEKKNTRVDGQEPKRRGPKPDSKPALTRRQELNRQAQRTHRERKELYIKGLEVEVLRLKESFSNISRDKSTLAEENRQLRNLLAQHGISWSGSGGIDELTNGHSNNEFTNINGVNGAGSTSYTSSGSISGTYATGSAGYSPPPNSARSINQSPTSQFGNSGMPNGMHAGSRSIAQQQSLGGHSSEEYDQAGIDFVLTLERPCMVHIPIMMVRAEGSGPGEVLPCGHALMATCPPTAHAHAVDDPNVPYRAVKHSSEQQLFKVEEGEEADVKEVEPAVGMGGFSRQQKTWDINVKDLANLMDLSQKLQLDGQITPVQAWGMALGHFRFSELSLTDFAEMANELIGKVRCYGFGAVLEEFEVLDALENIFSRKSEMYPHSAVPSESTRM